MEIRNARYQELIHKELTYEMIKDFIKMERNVLSATSILDHVLWLIGRQEEKEENK